MTDSRPNIGITPLLDDRRLRRIGERAGGTPLILEVTDDPVVEPCPHRRVAADRRPGRRSGRVRRTAAPVRELDRARDALRDSAVPRRRLAADVPMLAICRGVQVLNVAAGGTLVQDIPSAVTSTLNHSLAQPKDGIAHSIDIRPSSRLAIAAAGRAAGLDLRGQQPPPSGGGSRRARVRRLGDVRPTA